MRTGVFQCLVRHTMFYPTAESRVLLQLVSLIYDIR